MQGFFYPPDRRRRDLDNVGGKALIDALQYAGLFKDDCQIKKIHLEMLEPVPQGLCIVKLESIDNVENKNKMLCMRHFQQEVLYEQEEMPNSAGAGPHC